MPDHGHGIKKRGRKRRQQYNPFFIPQDKTSEPDYEQMQQQFTGQLQPAAIVPGQSMNWKSAKQKERDEYDRYQKLILHIDHNEPAVPTDFDSWKEHKAARIEDEMKEKLRIIAKKEAEYPKDELRRKELRATKAIPVRPSFITEKADLTDNRSTVLSMPSIWSYHYTPANDRPDAQWPTLSECRHEGPGRRAGQHDYQRFLPIPRQPGNDTVCWTKRRSIIPLSRFDRATHPFDIMKAEEANKTKIENENDFWLDAEHSLGQSLLDEVYRL